MVRRKAGSLLPLELDLLAAAVDLQRGGAGDCYGYALAKALAAGNDARRLVAHGTLYKALSRLTGSGLLDSWWEDAAVAEAEGRPRRRLYRVTGAGERALSDAGATMGRAGYGRSGGRAAVVPGTAPA